MKNLKRIPFGRAFLLFIAFGLTSCASVFASNSCNSYLYRDSIIPVKSQGSFIELYKLQQTGLLNKEKRDGKYLIFERKQSLSQFRVEKRSWQIFMLGVDTKLSPTNSLDYEKLNDNVEYKDFPLLYNKLKSDKNYKLQVDKEKNLISFQFKNSRITVNRSDWGLYSTGIFAKNPRYEGTFNK